MVKRTAVLTLLATAACGGGLLPGVASARDLSGHVEAAGQPIQGASVRLFAGGARTATVVGSARTAADGSFTLSYRRPAGARTPLYAIADGGRLRGGALGRQVRLLAVAGLAGSAQSTLWIDERSTVAGAYALSRFIDGTRVSGPAPGLPNAVATAANLFETRAGKVSFVLGNSPNGLATEALPTFNTLANALASCTTGGAADCRRLLDAARPSGGPRPADTLAAAVAIARNPSQGTHELFRRSQAGAGRFRPALRAAPDAWILALVYVGSGMNAPGFMAFDRHGNSWITNNFQIPGTTAALDLTVLDPAGQPTLGSPLTGGGVRGGGWGIAIDPRGRVWTANFAGDSMSLFDARGRALSPPGGFTQGNLARPQGVAVDREGNVWIANFGNDSVTLYPRGNPRAARSIRGGGIENPFGIAIDAQGHAWVTNGAESTRPGSVTELLPDGRIAAGSPITGGALRSPQGIALDSAGNKWIANLASASVTRILPDGTVSNSPLGRPSVRGGWGVAVDGADHVWVGGFLGANVTELCGVGARGCPPGTGVGEPISPARAGYASAAFEHITGVVIDASGNVWLANNWTTGSPFREFVGGNGLVQLVGVATPVRTPMFGLPRRP